MSPATLSHLKPESLDFLNEFKDLLSHGRAEGAVEAPVNDRSRGFGYPHSGIQTLRQGRIGLGAKLNKSGIQMPSFRYALVNRPAGIGCLPRGLTFTVETRPATAMPHHEWARHGVLVSDRELAPDELRNFEPAGMVDGAMLDELMSGWLRVGRLVGPGGPVTP